MILLKVFCCFAIFTYYGLCDEEFDYYWRDYHGLVSADAVPGGLDINGKPTYIGQVYVHKHGILPARIYPGKAEVTASRDGVHTSSLSVKILCSLRKEHFVWHPATANNLQVVTVGKHLVVGGTENGKLVNIGRVQYQGQLIVGKVCGYNMGNAKLFFPYENKEVSTTSYEVLVYDNEAVTVTERRFGL